jgi:hypothetical protein
MTDGKSPPSGNAKDRRRYERSRNRDQGTLGFSYELDSAPQRQNKPQSSSASDQKKDYKTPMPGLRRFIKDVFSRDAAAAWTAFFTAVLMVFTGLLYMVSCRANDVNIATQRATVNPSGPGWAKIPSPDGKSIIGWRFMFAWQNSGRTPANNASEQTNVSIGDVHPEKSLNFGTLPQNPTYSLVLGPGANYGTPQIDIPLDQLKGVAEGKQHMFFWGWFVYDDGIPHTPRRLTEYCMDITKMTFTKPDDMSNPANELYADWPPCKTHYCYDDKCEDYAAHTQ